MQIVINLKQIPVHACCAAATKRQWNIRKLSIICRLLKMFFYLRLSFRLLCGSFRPDIFDSHHFDRIFGIDIRIICIIIHPIYFLKLFLLIILRFSNIWLPISIFRGSLINVIDTTDILVIKIEIFRLLARCETTAATATSARIVIGVCFFAIIRVDLYFV